MKHLQGSNPNPIHRRISPGVCEMSFSFENREVKAFNSPWMWQINDGGSNMLDIINMMDCDKTYVMA